MAKHIMIADDEVDVVQTVRIRLEANGYTVSDTMGERTVKDVLERKPDLLLLDVMMPGMDGYTVLARLRENPATDDIPVIFVTAMDTVEDEQRGLDLGAADYIAKPLRPPIVLARIRTQLEL